MFVETTATKKIFDLRKRLRGVAGGTSASKTISILLWCIQRAQRGKYKGELISIVSETFPHLRKGAIRDFLNIMEQHGYYNEKNHDKTNHVYTFPTGNKIEFFSADQSRKVRGPRRDILFINEANNIPFETFRQLDVRTKKIVWLDWNPVAEFWWYLEVAPNREHDFLTLTYKDNESMPKEEVDALEVYKANKQWWRVYGEGLLGEAEGRIYAGWNQVDEVPHEARLERYGLDFGYSNDPTGIVAVYYYNGGYILDEITYQKGLSNKQIADILNNVPKALVVADSAEPKSIDELKLYGVNVLPAQKGQGSVLQGIQFVQQQRISVTKTSTNLLKEYRNYLWEKDKKNPDRPVNVPSQGWDHILDAVRYSMESLRPYEIDELPPDDTQMFRGGYY